jgi:hypothetical protein
MIPKIPEAQLRAEVISTYCRGMLAGYAGEKKANWVEVPGLRRVKAFTISFGKISGSYTFQDMYWGNSTEYSNGVATIYHELDPVWQMFYGGWYKPDAIPFLKACLRNTLKNNEFYGGRGPARVQDGLWTYENISEFTRTSPGSWKNFSGEERAWESETPKGYHWYRGGLIIPL